jgi:kinase-associated protein B
MNSTFQIGDKVSASYKTGEYVGEIVEISSVKAAVKVLAVLKHPTQGDLHNPAEAKVPFFHQRRALAQNEIALMPLHTITPYNHSVPDYQSSLQQALHNDMEELRQIIDFAQRSLIELVSLQKDYFPQA